MWKLILSQAADGSWAATTTTAFALEARDRSETANLKPTLLMRLKNALGSAAEELNDENGDAADTVMDALRADEEDEAVAPRVGDEPEPEFAKDDPLSCSPLAILHSIVAVKTSNPSIDVARVWTTMCCVASLQRLNVSWIWGDGDLYDTPELTIVDAGREWVLRR